MATPKHPDNVGKHRVLQTITGEKVRFLVEDEIIVPHLPHKTGKLIYFQKLRFEKDNRLEYRFGYYMIGVKEGRKGQWVWGQYALMIPAKYLSRLLKEARAKGWEGV